MNYYNEFDPDAAAILRVLIEEGCIAPGVVDERSIEDVRPDELAGYTQCHFFAGIGIWSLALREAGWSDDRPVWTGSCPCQPFSAAGKGDGFADERHLWPAFHHLIAECRPADVFGEQVASKAVDAWIDLVHADMEALGYAFGSVPFPSAGVGAPHIRDRNYWRAAHMAGRGLGADRVAGRLGHTHDPRPQGHAGDGGAAGWSGQVGPAAEAGLSGGMADNLLQQRPDGQPGIGAEHDPARRLESAAAPAGLCGAFGLGDTSDAGPSQKRIQRVREQRLHAESGCSDGYAGDIERPEGCAGMAAPTGPTNGLWRDADWLLCRDGKWRPVEPGTFPLANAGTFRNRVAALRGAGNAINLKAAQTFIESVM